MQDELRGRLNACALQKVAKQEKLFSRKERQWCPGELRGVLADYNPLADPEKAEDSLLADCLLRAWEESSIRCDCQ